jgi:CMP-N-acetylneuraminic acid synthetase
MRVLGIVPARGGSRRVPRKNLAFLGGRTLVRRALETSLAAGCFETVALSSDDEAILREADGLPVTTVRRPAALAVDDSRTYDAVVHALETLEAAGGKRFDAVAVVQCTSPFTAPADLAAAVDLLGSTGAASVVSVVRVEAAHHPAKLKVLEGDRLRPWLYEDELTPAQELPPLWVRNGSIYASRRDVLGGGRLLDVDDLRAFEMPPERSFDVDTPRDLAFAEFLLRERRYSDSR